jgi:hypothetical protein
MGYIGNLAQLARETVSFETFPQSAWASFEVAWAHQAGVIF